MASPSYLHLPPIAKVANDTSTPGYLTSEHVARYLGVPTSLLAVWRNRKVGPRFYKMPGRHGAVYYREQDVFEYLESRYVLTERMPGLRRKRLRKQKEPS